jgi:hypothetical protein
MISRKMSFLVLASFSCAASAGTVHLVADTWDNIPRVEITSGMNAPNTPVSSYQNVARGWSADYADRVCYRRSMNPSDASSSLGYWNCSSALTSQTEDFSLR